MLVNGKRCKLLLLVLNLYNLLLCNRLCGLGDKTVKRCLVQTAWVVHLL